MVTESLFIGVPIVCVGLCLVFVLVCSTKCHFASFAIISLGKSESEKKLVALTVLMSCGCLLVKLTYIFIRRCIKGLLKIQYECIQCPLLSKILAQS